MATLLTLGASIAASSAPEASLILGVYVDPSGEELALDVTPHAAADQVLARSGDRQQVRVEATVALAPFGVTVAPISIGWGSEVNAGGHGSITMPASSANWVPGPLGYETQFGGPPPGAALIDVNAIYGSRSDPLAIPLTSGAVSAQSTRSLSKDGHTLQFEMLDYGGRSDGESFDYVLPALHGKRPGEMIREMATLAGVPSSRIAVPTFGPQLRKGFESLGTGWMGRARDLASSFGYALDFDGQGVLTAYRWPPTADPEAVFDARSFAAEAGLSADADASVPRCIKILGNAPEIPGGGGVVSFPPEIRETIEPFSPPRAQFRQDAGPDTFTATGFGTATVGNYVTERIETYRVKEGTCVLREEVVTWRWYAPRAARYQKFFDELTPRYAGTVWIYDPESVAGDSAEAYLWPVQRFVVVSRDVTVWHYDGPGEELTRKVVAHGGWYNRRAAIAEKDTPTDLPLTYYYEGNGRAVAHLAEDFYWGNDATAEFVNPEGSGDLGTSSNLASEITAYEFAGGYKTAETEVARTILALPGGNFLYSDGAYYGASGVGDGASEEYRVSSTKRVNYLPTGPSSSDIVTDIRGPNGEFVRRVAEGSEGYLPAIETCNPEIDAERSARPFEVEVCAVFSSGTGRTEIIQNDFVEDEAQATELAGWELRRRRAIAVKARVPLWAAGRPGTPVAIAMPRQGYPGLKGWVHGAEHSASGVREPAVTDLDLRIET